MEHSIPLWQREHLAAAKRKEWKKIETSEAVKVHRGEQARKLVAQMEAGVLKARWCIKGF